MTVVLATHCNECPCHGHSSARSLACNLGSKIEYRETADGELVEVSFNCTLVSIQTSLEVINPSKIPVISEKD
jgi:hypothetical protein